MLFQTNREPAWRELAQDLQGGGVAHAYLFSGHQGGGQGEAARLFAQALLCTSSGQLPCGRCPSCRAFLNRSHPDLHTLEPEGNSLKLEQVRALRSFFHYRPLLGRRQVFWIDQPELLTPEAANSLLKNLEEPLPETVFLLVTGRWQDVLPTVISRCRVISFRQMVAPASAPEEAGRWQDYLRLIRQGGEAELLRAVRQAGVDRQQARSLLHTLLSDLEGEYRERRQLMGEGGDSQQGVALLSCLSIILKGLMMLDENAQVQLVLALTLRGVQRCWQHQAGAL